MKPKERKKFENDRLNCLHNTLLWRVERGLNNLKKNTLPHHNQLLFVSLVSMPPDGLRVSDIQQKTFMHIYMLNTM